MQSPSCSSSALTAANALPRPTTGYANFGSTQRYASAYASPGTLQMYTPTPLLVDSIIESASDAPSADLWSAFDELLARRCECDLGAEGLIRLLEDLTMQVGDVGGAVSRVARFHWRIQQLQDLCSSADLAENEAVCSCFFRLYAVSGLVAESATLWNAVRRKNIEVADSHELVLRAVRRWLDNHPGSSHADRSTWMSTVFSIMQDATERQLNLPNLQAASLAICRLTGNFQRVKLIMKGRFGVDLEYPAAPKEDAHLLPLTAEVMEECVKAILDLRGEQGLSEALAFVEQLARYPVSSGKGEASLPYLIAGSTTEPWQKTVGCCDMYDSDCLMLIDGQHVDSIEPSWWTHRRKPWLHARILERMSDLDWPPSRPQYDMRLLSTPTWSSLLAACVKKGGKASRLSIYLFEQLCRQCIVALHMIRFAINLRRPNLSDMPRSITELLHLPSPAQCLLAIDATSMKEDDWDDKYNDVVMATQSLIEVMSYEAEFLERVVSPDAMSASRQKSASADAFNVGAYHKYIRRTAADLEDFHAKASTKIIDHGLYKMKRGMSNWPSWYGRGTFSTSSADPSAIPVGVLVRKQLEFVPTALRLLSLRRYGLNERGRTPAIPELGWTDILVDHQHVAPPKSTEELVWKLIYRSDRFVMSRALYFDQHENVAIREEFLAKPLSELNWASRRIARVLVAFEHFPHLRALLLAKRPALAALRGDETLQRVCVDWYANGLNAPGRGPHRRILEPDWPILRQEPNVANTHDEVENDFGAAPEQISVKEEQAWVQPSRT